MTRISWFVSTASCLLLLQGCDRAPESAGESSANAPADETAGAQPQIVELLAVGKKFVGPSEIPSGWTTFEFDNASGMVHFAMIDVPPDGVTAEQFSDTLATPFQEVMDAMNAGDEDAVNAAFAKFPAWVGDLRRDGGPGLVSPGLTARTTVDLKPGHYLIECYVKSDGVFHSTSPGDGQLGMVLPLTVTDENNGASEPAATATLSIRNSGLKLVAGKLTPGVNTIRVNFDEQQALPSFVGNDVHLLRVDDPDAIAAANAWMDWRDPEGLEDPSPVVFLGGINDMPAGEHGYFTVDLTPGDYAFIAEVPDPQDAGFILPFSVNASD